MDWWNEIGRRRGSNGLSHLGLENRGAPRSSHDRSAELEYGREGEDLQLLETLRVLLDCASGLFRRQHCGWTAQRGRGRERTKDTSE